MNNLTLNQSNEFWGITLESLKQIISSTSESEIKKIFSDAQEQSKTLEIKESESAQTRCNGKFTNGKFDISTDKYWK